MTRAQTAELAEILALLHNISETVSFETHGLDEDISLDFCVKLTEFLNNLCAKNIVLFELISPHVKTLHFAIKQVLHLRDTIRLGYSPLVLCHGDAHGNNVIQSDRLVLADWEDLRRAPVEADLFIYSMHKHGDVLLEAYVAARNGYHINRELLYFYVLRRRIEDVWVDIQRLTEESPDETEIVKLKEYIRQSIKDVQMTYHPK
jgi:thiamine kinase-like enzyme